jgi:DNA-binding CsgD family transcriptional regulator
MKRRDMHAIMRLTLNAGTGPEGGRNHCVSLVRSRRAGDYEAADVERFGLFAPHLRRASSIARHLDDAHAMLSGVTDVIEQNPAGIALLDPAGQIVLANRAIRAMAEMRDSFILKHRRIEALNRSDDSALQTLIGRACSPLGKDAVRAGAIRLERESGEPAFTAVIVPLAGGSWNETGAVAYLIVTDPCATSAPPRAMLAQLFDLTPAEARLAERLTMGGTAEQAAEALDIKISTARWHLASLYRKTGTNRQADLVRLLLSLPAIRA